MKNIIQYKHRKVLVLGLARSGVSAASLLHKLGAFVTVNDQKPFSENPEAQGLLEQGIKVICGSHPVELLDEGFELVVKNPGIPYDNPMIKKSAGFNDSDYYRGRVGVSNIRRTNHWYYRNKRKNNNDNYCTSYAK